MNFTCTAINAFSSASVVAIISVIGKSKHSTTMCNYFALSLTNAVAADTRNLTVLRYRVTTFISAQVIQSLKNEVQYIIIFTVIIIIIY